MQNCTGLCCVHAYLADVGDAKTGHVWLPTPVQPRCVMLDVFRHRIPTRRAPLCGQTRTASGLRRHLRLHGPASRQQLLLVLVVVREECVGAGVGRAAAAAAASGVAADVAAELGSFVAEEVADRIPQRPRQADTSAVAGTDADVRRRGNGRRRQCWPGGTSCASGASNGSRHRTHRRREWRRRQRLRRRRRRQRRQRCRQRRR
mmetsp:Transcript_48442/g.156312  ORF Transcript_48442/g.156312 Transcript_48442/m.156312 type:complete len:204 (-) Transcript_48442:3838-4449(-)